MSDTRRARLIARAGVVRLAAGLAMAAAAGVVCAEPDDPPIPTEAVVKLLPGVTIEQFNQRYGTVLQAAVGNGLKVVYHVELPEPFTEQQLADMLFQDPQGVIVEWGELNFFIDDDVRPGTQSFFLGYTVGQFENQYSIGLTGQPAAAAQGTGTGVKVALIDTGVDVTHPALAGRIASGAYNFIQRNTNVADVGDGIDNDGNGSTDEMVGHGTMMAGVILSMAPDAVILPLRVMDSDGRGSSFRVAEAIYYAMEQGADVINLSLGSTEELDLLEDAVEDARYWGCIVVASVGNDGDDTELCPSTENDTIAVAATNQFDQRAAFSNYGDHVFICAPGDDVVGTMPGGQYAQGDGTSCAAAVVSGACALLRSVAPWTETRAMQDALEASAVNINAQNPGFNGELGAGRINVAAALNFLPPCPADLTATAVVGGPGFGVPDERLTNDDFFYYLIQFANGSAAADLTTSAVRGSEGFGEPNGTLNNDDFFYYLYVFARGC